MSDIERILKEDKTVRYRMLARMQSDCEYSINSNFICSHLWGITVPDHIRYMKLLWKSFPKDEKPQWLKYRKICEYEKKLLIIVENSNNKNGSSCDFCYYSHSRIDRYTGGVMYYCTLLKKDVLELRGNRECPIRLKK